MAYSSAEVSHSSCVDLTSQCLVFLLRSGSRWILYSAFQSNGMQMSGFGAVPQLLLLSWPQASVVWSLSPLLSTLPVLISACEFMLLLTLFTLVALKTREKRRGSENLVCYVCSEIMRLCCSIEPEVALLCFQILPHGANNLGENQ